MKITLYNKNGYIIQIDHELFNGRLRFGSSGSKVYIVIDGRILDCFHLFDLKGALNFHKLLVCCNSDNMNKLKFNNTTLKILIKKIKERLKNEIVNIVYPIFLEDTQFTLENQHILSNIIYHQIFTQDKDSNILIEKMLVHTANPGLQKISNLTDKKLYVVLQNNRKVRSKAKRASNMGFNIIYARSIKEKKLLKYLLGALDIKKLPESRLKRIQVLDNLSVDEKLLLNNGLQVLNVLTDTKISIHRNFNNDLKSDQKHHENYEQALLFHSSSNHSIDNRPINYIENKGNKPLKEIKLGLCSLDREDINAITNVKTGEISLNINSPIIKKMLGEHDKVQRIMVLEELSHEYAHILGYGLITHDLGFFKIQRILKYKCLLEL